MQATYFVMLMISIGYVFFLLTRFQKHISVYYILMTVAVVIVNLGYLQIAGARTEEAVFAFEENCEDEEEKQSATRLR